MKKVWQYDNLTTWDIGTWYIRTVVWQPELLAVTKQNYIAYYYFNPESKQLRISIKLLCIWDQKSDTQEPFTYYTVYDFSRPLKEFSTDKCFFI